MAGKMLDIDIDAFFKAQDQRMREPEDDMDEFLHRRKQGHRYDNFYHVPLKFLEENTPSSSIPPPEASEAPTEMPPLSRETPKASFSGLFAPSDNSEKQRVPSDDDDEPMRSASPVPTRTSPRRHASSSLRTPLPYSIPDTSHGKLKRKESPTKPDKPPRKQVVIDPSLVLSSPIENSSELSTAKEPITKKPVPVAIRPPPPPRIAQAVQNNRKRKASPTKPEQPSQKKVVVDASLDPIEISPAPVSRKPQSKKSKATNRPFVKIPPPPVPDVIDLSVQSPIEEPDFSVVVSRFEPAVTSTQRAPPAAEISMDFADVQARMERQRQRKKTKEGSKTSTKGGKHGQKNPTLGDDSSIISSSPRPSSPEPKRKAAAPTKPTTTKSTTKPIAKPKPVAIPKPPPKKQFAQNKNKKPSKLAPKDWCQMLLDLKVTNPEEFKVRKNLYLEGMSLFYYGAEMTWAGEATQKRTQFIIEYGGKLCPEFDPSVVTHIIVSESAQLTSKFLATLGVTRLKQIPDHIPIVRWQWIADGAKRELWENAAFPERMPPNRFLANKKIKTGAGGSNAVAGPSRISAFGDKKRRERSIHDSEDEDEDEPDTKPAQAGPLLSPPSSPQPQASSPHIKTEPSDDPLAEFYAMARADRDRAFGRHGEVEDPDETDLEEADSDSDNEGPAGPPAKRGWLVDSKDNQRTDGPNEFIAKKLKELSDLHAAKLGQDDHWRVYSYRKAIPNIRRYPKRIKSYEEAMKITGVGEKTALKIMEIINTGDLRRIGYENTADLQIRQIFQGVYGVGQKTAYKWYAAGCRSLKDVKAGVGGVTLTPAQAIGIEFYDDINDRMPREEAQALFDIIKPIALEIDPKLEVHIMGSFRRGKKDCGDIDIMITRCPSDGRTHAGILHHLLKALHERKIITEDLALPEDPFDSEAIYRGLCHLPTPGSRRRRIDFLTIPWKSRGAALLYYTGDDIFNRAMRYKANHMGYSLNQKGLFAGVVRDPRNRMIKLNTGNIVASETEEEIFHLLGVPFQKPHERVRA
ncbi:DNA polymerase lambda [Favolaschia claudopus]|uniref:DNA polymerase lambda n=1 Tax=Favolaschia claudopus TaxID=2862362 RepID=A0AAW0DRM0_9AGAR